MNRRRILIATPVLLAALLIATYFINHNLPAKKSDIEHPLLAKRIFIDDPNDPLINFTALRSQIKQYFVSNNLSGSVYFEYLPTGTNVRVDEDSEEVAASLMKIPAVMELYKANELGRIDLDTRIPLDESWLDNRYGELYKKGAGYELTLREAAQLALAQSDNTAVTMVIAKSRDLLEPTENVLTYLDVDFSRPDSDTLTISARSYSSFLKCLYFSCYLNTRDSEQLLTYLTNSEFNNRLKAGLPDNVVIAHKIGTYSDTQSDCGIIYEPSRNYVLCIMLKVQDNDSGNAHIATISKMSYDFIHNAASPK